MRIVRTSTRLVGKVLARTVHSADGRQLLIAGTVLTPGFVRGLAKWGYPYVAIEDNLLKGVNASDPIAEITMVKATSAVQRALSDIARTNTFSLGPVADTIEDIVNDIKSTKNVVVSLSAMRSFDDYTFIHSVNVCVLSVLLGCRLLLNRFDLRKLATGAMLHDIGKIKVPQEILNKPSRLTPEEYAVVMTHATRGYELLCSKTSLVSAHVAFQHHERLDGSGYPRGLVDKEIHDYGKVAAVADVYDALTSDRPYRKAFTAPEAIAVLTDPKCGVDREYAKLLFSRLAAYPEGTVLRLSDGRVSVVIAQTDNPLLPRVRVVSTRGGMLCDPADIDLREDAGASPVKILTDYPEDLAEQIEEVYGNPGDGTQSGASLAKRR